MAAAARVLGRAGFADSSIKEIAREAGVAPGLVHYYFAAKEDLLIAVVEQLERELVADWQGAVAGVDDPLRRIVAALDHTTERCAQRPEFRRLLFDLHVVGLANPAVRRRCAELWSRHLDDVEAEVRSVVERLPAPGDVPPRDLAEAIAGAVNGIALAALVGGTDPAAPFAALKAMLLSLVVTAYVSAGQEPPVEHVRALLPRGSGDGTG